MINSRSSTLVLLMGVLLVTGVETHAAPTLASLQWSQRVLLVFSPPGDARLDEQRRILDGSAGDSASRDLRVVYLVAGEATPGLADPITALRERFFIAEKDFRVLLIGKDGGVKLSSDHPAAPCDLYATIDAMPMRRREMAERGEAGGDRGC